MSRGLGNKMKLNELETSKFSSIFPAKSVFEGMSSNLAHLLDDVRSKDPQVIHIHFQQLLTTEIEAQ